MKNRVWIYSVAIVLSHCFILPLFSQQSTPLINATLRGIVVDSLSGEPIEGVSIQLAGVTHSVRTDGTGHFQFVTGQKLPFTLLLSSIGYRSKKIIASQAEITISLQPTLENLEEVVVVGYGTQKRRDLTGSVAKIDAAEVNKIPVASFDAQLQGKLPGVQVTTNSGVPGESIFLRVRGTTSINSSSDPLYIVDGVFLNNTSLQTIGLGGRTSSPLTDINPADIESIEVLKDASATAIYGSRGANGVIIITTKKGSYGSKTKIDVNVQGGWAEANLSLLPQLASGSETAALANEWWINSGLDNPSLNQTFANRPFRPVSEGGKGNPEDQETYDRLGFLLRKGKLQDYSVGIQGGGEKSRYYIGAGYTGQEAFIKVIDFSRANVKFNFDQQLSNRVKIGLTNNFSRTYRNQARTGDGPQVSLFNSAVSSATNIPIFTEDGAVNGTDNTYTLVDNYDVNTTSLRYVGSVFAEVDILDGLKFRSNFSADYNLYDESQYWNSKTSIGIANGNQATSGITRNSTWINEQTLTYQKRFAEHQLTALIGNTLQSNVLDYSYLEGNGFANDSYKLISSAANIKGTENWTKYTISSFFGRLGYSYADRYFAEATVRADGSSKFGANNRWGYFPAFSLGWRLRQERFLAGASWLNDLKIRASYGLTGNQAGISNFAARGLWSGDVSYADIHGSSLPGIGPYQLGNDNLRWEKTAQADLGLDASLFNNRVSLTVDLYHKYTSDLLLEQPIKGSSGFSNYWANVGEISNRGYEILLQTANIKNKNFSWNTSINVSGNTNRIEHLPTQITQYTRDWVILKEGYSLNSFWLYEQLYVDPANGNAVFEGQLDDGSLPTSARKIFRNAYPKFYGGIGNTFSYRQFDLAVDFSFQYGNYSLNLYRYFRERNPSSGGVFTNVLNRWQEVGDETDVPRLTSVGLNYTIDANSRYLEDASFLKLRQLSFGYRLPKELVQKARLTNARIYFVGSNLFLWSKYTGDPESNVTSNPNAQGIGSFGTPPQPKTFQLGLNVTL
ncbi:SusC/RagA family TonB-linked outer membrane protein [Sphingobacterium bambusae]|uniref:TonB-dependent receptor n=1 Tax=Sphingobacterium bambusae TaxID=662858 RepID=A0ABW6BDA1_9SPHI|nr:TonB-dependent receptor [Sphingobacterium bambusae]WPL48659.1 TonB-dependent receptor [Sphingobacterium bambusae]